ncbi:hypothetical protein ACHWQZ_G017673 [Mnemiopsis leidyi]
MDRSCPKRRKTKKIVSDGDVKKYLGNNDCDPTEKILHLTKVPEGWEPGLMLSLYHDGFTVNIPPDSKLASQKVAYDETDFIRNIEQGDIPDQLVPLLEDVTLIDNKLVTTITDYRGFPRPGSTQPYTLDFPITTHHVLSRSTQSLVLELYDSLGESLPFDQLTKLENYLLMLNNPPLCLDTSTQVFEVKNDIHSSQNQLNNAAVRRLIKESNKSDSINVLSDIVAEMSLVIQHGKRDNPNFHSSKDSSVDGKLGKLKISSDAKPPNFLNEILDLCKEKLNRSLSPRSAGVPLQNLPHLKPAPFITNTKHPGGPVGTPQTPAPSASGAVVMTPMSPNIPQKQPTAVHSMSSPLGPGSQPPNMVHQPPSSIQAPKNVAAVSRMPMDPSKPVRGPYTPPGYIVPAQQINPAAQRPAQQRMSVPMMPMGSQPQNQIMAQPGGMIMHMSQPQQLRPVSSAGRIDQSMNNPRPNAGMMMPQQYPRSYQYPNVQQMPRGYVDPNGFIPVQQQPRPAQVLQISLPPNMNPQSAPRQARPTLGPNPGLAQPHQAPLHRVPYNQVCS